MKIYNNLEAWFITGTQHLYGEETLEQVAANAGEIVNFLDGSDHIPVKIVFKPVLTNPDAINKVCLEANAENKCIGVITWMHTFSPAKMWINGLKHLSKPILHLHTQFNQDIPWDSIDMDFMNLNQSAHGGREYGFMLTRMGMNRKVIVGHWKEEKVHERLNVWLRAATAWNDWQNGKVARFGDNMREVAVTEGNKVSAQIQFGYDVYGYGVGDLVEKVNAIPEDQLNDLVKKYQELYSFTDMDSEKNKQSVYDAAKIELGMRLFLEEGKFNAFTTTFEDLHGLKQLPGLAVQRLMADGFGFGAEGDWKTAALVRAMKVMAKGLKGGTSFMEDYTYHLDPRTMKVLGAHMLEVCPTIAEGKPSMEVHPLGIGGKEDPARLVFNVPSGNALNAALMDLGNRFRLLVNPCQVITPDQMLPKLPVARVMWIPEPDLEVSATSWILAGGAHHTGFSMAITSEFLEDFAEIAGIEYLLIDKKTQIRDFKNELRWNEMYYKLNMR